jgi:hypothetical protein
MKCTLNVSPALMFRNAGSASFLPRNWTRVQRPNQGFTDRRSFLSETQNTMISLLPELNTIAIPAHEAVRSKIKYGDVFRVWGHGDWTISQARIANLTCNNIWRPKWSRWENYDCLIMSDLSTQDDSKQQPCYCLVSCILIHQREDALLSGRKAICVRLSNKANFEVRDQFSRRRYTVRCQFRFVHLKGILAKILKWRPFQIQKLE